MKTCCFTADGTAMLRLKVEMQEPLHLQARNGHLSYSHRSSLLLLTVG